MMKRLKNALCTSLNKIYQEMLCPVCKNTENIALLPFQCKDYTVSQELFSIAHCPACSHRFTVNPPAEAEIGKYYHADAYISHSNTQKGLINRLYHIVRKYALRQKYQLILQDTAKQSGSILDIGCGIGAFPATMQAKGWQAKGLEPEPAARQQAKALFGLEVQPSEDLFSLAADSFDAVTMWHVLEHVHRLDDYLAQIHKILKTNGRFFVAVPNYIALDEQIYKQYWAAYDVPRHLHHFCPTSMQKLTKTHGFTVEKIRPMPFDSFYVSLLSEKYKTGSYKFLAGFWNGLRSYLHARKRVETGSSILYVIRKK